MSDPAKLSDERIEQLIVLMGYSGYDGDSELVRALRELLALRQQIETMRAFIAQDFNTKARIEARFVELFGPEGGDTA